MATIILFVVNLFVILCFFISHNCDSNLKKNFVVGVELPQTLKSEEKILSSIKQFKITNAVIFLVFAFSFLAGFFVKNPTVSIIILISIVVLASIVNITLYGVLNRKLKTIKKDAGFDTKEDDFWIWGMFYNNPNDNNITVKSRYGVNTAFNLGTKTGKSIFAVTVSALIVVAVFIIILLVR